MINDDALEELKKMFEDNLREEIHTLMDEGQKMLNEKQSTKDDTLEKLRKGIEAQLDAHVFHQTVETNPTIIGIIQCYLLLGVIDRLDLAIAHLHDIEHEISQLNPEYK